MTDPAIHQGHHRGHRGIAPRLRLTVLGVLLIVLWALSLAAITGLLQQGSWLVWGIAITTVVTGAALVSVAAPGLSQAATIALPGTIGAAIWVIRLLVSGGLRSWGTEPGETLARIQSEVLRGSAPIAASTHFEDLLLLCVVVWSAVAMFVFTGAGRLRIADPRELRESREHAESREPREHGEAREPGAHGEPVDRGVPHAVTAALAIALPALIVPVVTNERFEVPYLAALGAIVLAVLWLASPRVTFKGGIAAVSALALAAGVFTVLPESRDRIWNGSLQYGPVGEYVDDVTIELARSLGERSQAPVFTHSSSDEQPQYFRLATLSTFSGGTWLPDEELDAEGLGVDQERSLTGVRPTQSDEPLAELEALSGGERDSYGSIVVQTPTGSFRFSPVDGRVLGFSPSQLEWNEHAFEYAGQRRGYVDVKIAGLRSSWLPLPTGTARVSKARATLDLNPWVWADSANTARSQGVMTQPDDSFRAEIYPGGGEPPRAALRWLPPELLRVFPEPAAAPPELRPYLELPGSLPESLLELKQRVEFEGLDRVSAASALEHYFRQSGGFSYDESAPFLPGSDPADPYSVMDALLTTRAGFCVHYATTFAVAARSLGVPTRVAVGYASRSQGATPVTVRGKDLHAWPEIYVDYVGWVPYEPTPGGAGLRAQSDEETDAVTVDAETAAPETESPEAAAPELTERPQAADEADDSAGADQAGGGADAGGLSGAVVVGGVAGGVLLLLLLGAAAPALLRALGRARRLRAIRAHAEPAGAAWAELTALLRDYGVVPGAFAIAPRSQTPEAIAEWVVASGVLTESENVRGVGWLATEVSAERYAPAGSGADPRGVGGGTERQSSPSPHTRRRLAAVVAGVSADLSAGATRRARARARWRPASLRRRGLG
ncbi:transglutaminase-like domain-containing protein [Leucobacter albus]|uniref:Transglutaminase-like domain-containing protein n=1 Tax=Leucobacter albus TaxID=272210 RepID=A0ABW3TK70_9MICO